MATTELTEQELNLDLGDYSRWRGTPIFEETTTKHGRTTAHGIWFRPTVPVANDNYHMVTAEHEFRLDRISYQYYGTPHLAWAIVAANPETVKDPIADIIPGRVLRIPKLQNLLNNVIE